MFRLTPITKEEKPSIATTTDSFITETFEIENESDYQNEYDFSVSNIQGSPSESNNSEAVTIECAGRFEPDFLEVGELVVTSGSIVACDPLCFSNIEPFIVSVPKGSFPVVIGMTRFENGNHIVSDATVHFSYEKVIEWQPALTKSQNPYYSVEEISDYAVDSGIGCFMDAEVAELLLSKIKDESYRHYVIAKLLRNPIHNCNQANIELKPETGGNLITFSSGFGDGIYDSKVGYDKSGKVVCIVTDFVSDLQMED